jgi:CheY-like chemotaxis protein/HPt (histidine-containing phosphotransfer) domain-containing protein
VVGEKGAPAAPVRAEPEAQRPQAVGGRILLAEDNPVNQMLAVNMLDLVGCTVEVAENGKLAVEAWARGGHDLILMDVQMPEMDGFQATAEIRRREGQAGVGRPIPIIALTANAMQGDRERCLEAGMSDYMSKPFGLERLREVLDQWMPRREASPGTPSEAVPQVSGAPVPAVAASQPVAAAGDAGGAAETPLIDQAALDNIRALGRKGAPPILDRIIDVYFKDSRKLLDTLRDSIAKGDAPEIVQRAAHTLKSSSANLGATQLAALCRELEALAREKRLDGAPALLAEIEGLHPSVCAALARERSEQAA